MRILMVLLLLAPTAALAQVTSTKGDNAKTRTAPTLGAYLKDGWQVNAADLSQAREFSTVLISRRGEVRLCLVKADRSLNGMRFVTETCVPIDPEGP
jgi:hypothetical protein